MDQQLAHILETHFRNEGDLARAKAIIELTRTRFQAYQEGTLQASLLVGMVNSGHTNGRSLPPPEMAYGWLHLRSGHVHMIKTIGSIKPLLNRLPECADLLQGNIESTQDFRNAEIRLNAFCAGCSVKLYRFGLIIPNMTFLADVNEVHGLGRIEAIARKVGSPLIEAEWEPLAAHFYGLLGDGNSDIQAFHAGLDADALHMLELIAGSYPTDANQVLVFNFFAVGSPKQRRYRIQAALQLPWLIPLLTGLQLDDWRLDSSSSDDGWPEHWQDMRPTIVDAIDSGQPLFVHVARCFNVSRSVIAWSRYHVLPTLRYVRHYYIGTLLRLLAVIPVQHRPDNEEEWEMLDRRISQYVEVISASYSIPPFLLLPERGLSTERGQVIERIMIHWLREESSEGLGFGSVEHISAFLMALAEALYDHLESSEATRRAVNSQHETIMLNWLQSVRLRDLATLSVAWQSHLAGKDSSQTSSAGLAWQLVQLSHLPLSLESNGQSNG